MNKRLLSLFAALVVVLLFAATGCEKQGPAESAGEKVDQAMEKAGEKMEEAGKAVEEAAEGQK